MSKHRRNNILGLAAEQAALLWLRTIFPDDSVSDVGDLASPSHDIDVTVGSSSIGFEVKSTTYDRWVRSGRAVSGDQLATTGAAVYLWVATPDSDRPKEVHLVGWSPTRDVREGTSRTPFSGISTRPRGGTGFSAPDFIRTDDVPSYGLDDPGFDAFEADQDLGESRGYLEREETEPAFTEQVWLPESLQNASVYPSGPRALAYLDEHGWPDGSEPRPGSGHRTDAVLVSAEIRQLDALLPWIQAGMPDR